MQSIAGAIKDDSRWLTLGFLPASEDYRMSTKADSTLTEHAGCASQLIALARLLARQAAREAYVHRGLPAEAPAPELDR